jgi:LysM repeat protein
MAKYKSINGWEVIESYSDPKLDMKTIPGTTAKIKMRKEVLPLFLALSADYNKQVAKIRPSGTGAFNPRKSNLSTTGAWSDHASGTAVDLNWGHEGAVGPNGGMKTMNDRQIKACADIKKLYEIVIWGGDKARGGDYRTPQYWDPMHYALKPGTTLTDVKRVIKKLGIDANGRRAGVNYSVLDKAKEIIASEVANEKPESQKVPPKKAPAVRKYTVKEGDTLGSIAKAKNTTLSELKAVNKLETTRLKVGQKLILPKAKKK